MLIINILKIGFKLSFLKIFIVFSFLFVGLSTLKAQNLYSITHEDSLALESIIIEKYYESTGKDSREKVGGHLPKHSVVYRIYVDMKPGYYLQAVYGNENHELFLKTSTTFFNNLYNYGTTAFNVHPLDINENTVALDSWLTMGAGSRMHMGILKPDDTDGSIIKRNGLDKADGLTTGILPTFKQFNLDLAVFYGKIDFSFLSTKNGAWAAIEGVKGPTSDNRVLIAQLTTDGILSFELNIQIGTPTNGVLNFVARNPLGSEIQFDGLIH
jgi:hypothetical protein